VQGDEICWIALQLKFWDLVMNSSTVPGYLRFFCHESLGSNNENARKANRAGIKKPTPQKWSRRRFARNASYSTTCDASGRNKKASLALRCEADT
jgi:hypothetical protein